jgi:hypothetical protein
MAPNLTLADPSHQSELRIAATPDARVVRASIGEVRSDMFCATRGITKAAKQLALSPPRVSEMVRNLEERLGVRLVERTTRSVAPTAAD